MSMQFLCNMTFTPIIPGAALAAAAPANNNMETATQRRRRQRAASVQRRIKHMKTVSTVDLMTAMTSHEGATTDLITTTAATLTTRTMAVVAAVEAAAVAGSQSRQNDRGRRQYSPARRSNRDPRPPQHGWGDLPPPTAGGQDAIQHGGWLVPFVPQARQNIDVAASIDVSQIDAEVAPPQNLDAAQPASVEVIDLVSPETVAVAEPIEALQPVDAQAPLEVEEASEAQEPLDAPQTDIGEAQPEALDTADTQPRAVDPEVGAQAPVEVAEDVDVHAQEVADAQATANVNLVAGDDGDAVAPLDAAGPTQ
ncbi:unnamed protein product [Aphanomyces euteiches]